MLKLIDLNNFVVFCWSNLLKTMHRTTVEQRLKPKSRTNSISDKFPSIFCSKVVFSPIENCKNLNLFANNGDQSCYLCRGPNYLHWQIIVQPNRFKLNSSSISNQLVPKLLSKVCQLYQLNSNLAENLHNLP